MYYVFATSCFLSAVTIGLIAQIILRWTATYASRVPAQLSGYKVARLLLDGSNLQHVEIEQTPARFSEHYDTHRKILRLSRDTYHGRTLPAVGFAAHEAGHAISNEHLVISRIIRAFAIPSANFGSLAAIVLIVLGFMLQVSQLALAGIGIFCVVVILQLVNLPFEHAVSRMVQARIVELQILDEKDLSELRRVLHAAALSNLAAVVYPFAAIYDLTISSIRRIA